MYCNMLYPAKNNTSRQQKIGKNQPKDKTKRFLRSISFLELRNFVYSTRCSLQYLPSIFSFGWQAPIFRIPYFEQKEHDKKKHNSKAQPISCCVKRYTFDVAFF